MARKIIMYKIRRIKNALMIENQQDWRGLYANQCILYYRK